MKKPIILCLLLFVAMTTNAQLTSALPDEAWRESEWICVADAPEVTGRVDDHTRAADGASWFFTTIWNEQKVVKALWMTVSLGVNELYVNGERIGREVLRPGFSHHSRTKYSFTYDITRQFHKKKGQQNNLEAQVTPGWWADKIITPSGSNGMYGQKCAFRGVLELTFADGTTRRYGTNTKDWRADISGPVTHAAIFDGEEYDARKLKGHQLPVVLKTPAVSREYKGIIVPENGAEVYHLTELALNPKRAYVYSTTEGATAEAYGKILVEREYQEGKPMVVRPGEHLVVDFGQNCAAVPSFRFKAKAGTHLSCLPAELLNDGNGAKSRGMDGPEGSIHRRNLRIHEKSIRLDYTFADSKKAVDFTPRATFFGYRYVDITVTDEVVIERIQSVPVSSITPEMETGHITTGNNLVNQLISNTLWGMRSNYLSVPTDCPQRNERLGWTADTQVFCETGTFFANTLRFFHKWLRDLRDTQSAEGGYPGVAPAGQYGSWQNECMRVGWADAGIIVPWTIWKQYGDATIIEESWESMTRYMSHISATKYDHVALSKENGNYQWADWLSYEPLESCGGGAFKDGQPLPEAIDYWNYLCASYWAIDAAMMSDMARATGRNAAEYDTMVTKAKDYLREHFFNADGTFKTPVLNTMQTPALFALHNKLFDGNGKDRMIERLRENFRQHGDCLQTGFLGTSILMPTLTDNGMADVAYTLLFQRKNPSWLYSIDNGATTIWERWNSYTRDKGMGPNGMNSFNHYAYGVVCQWIWQTCAGIAADPACPGFKHIIMRPIPDRRLGHLEASYRSAAGLIKSSWKYEGDEWIWTFTIPQGATATVTLPGEEKGKDYDAGTYTIKKQLTESQEQDELKPRLVVCTDIAPADVEPDDMESMVRLMAYADMFEIEAIITSVGWNCDPYPAEWAQYLHRVIEAYGKDVPKLMRRSGQTAFMPLANEGRQHIGYWPSVEYVRSRAVMGSRHGGIKAIGEGNDSEGSRLLIRLADEADERPIYVAAWGGTNTLAQAIWRVQQTRSADEVRNFVRKFRLFTITDQDMKYDMRMNLAYSSHQWLRKDFPDDLQFVWDEGAWQEQCELGKQHWQQHKDGIQGHGALGKEYPTYKWGVEGDTPSMLFVMPNGLNDPEDPRQAGWAGYHERGRCSDSLTTAWGCWNEHVRANSVGYKRRFYPDELSDFLARMQWAEKGEGNRNPQVNIDRHKGHQPIHIDAKAGDTVRLDASKSADPDGDSLTFLWWQQPEIGTAKAVIEHPDQPTATVHIPADARDTTIHIVCEVHDSGPYHLVSYRRIIIRVTPNGST